MLLARMPSEHLLWTIAQDFRYPGVIIGANTQLLSENVVHLDNLVILNARHDR